MWDNLGRIIAEYPHLQEIVNNRIELIDTDENITKLQQDDPAFFVSGHLANWEAGALALGLWPSTNAAQVYRAPNNPYVAKILRRFRSPEEKIITFAKSTGTRALMKHLKQGGHVGILIDQKYNQGIPVKFFGHDAMTSPAFAELGLKYRAHLIPTRFERLKGANFRLTLYPGMKLYEGTNTDKSPKDLIDEAHKYLEIWITERPEQWLWLHRRWESKRLEWLLNDGRDGN
jgi:KDO2-lipid IV(A) lauroyltransferase